MNTDKLIKLAELKTKGLISEAEFEEQKKQLLSGGNIQLKKEEKSMWDYFESCITKKYACFSGRARRKEFWSFILFNLLIQFLIGFCLGFAFGITKNPMIEQSGNMISLFILIVLFIPGMAVSIRRLHDVGFSGWWAGVYYLLAPIVYFFGFLVESGSLSDLVILSVIANLVVILLFFFLLIVAGFLPSQKKENKYGSVPE